MDRLRRMVSPGRQPDGVELGDESRPLADRPAQGTTVILYGQGAAIGRATALAPVRRQGESDSGQVVREVLVFGDRHLLGDTAWKSLDDSGRRR